MSIRWKHNDLVVFCVVTARISMQHSMNVSLATKFLVSTGGLCKTEGGKMYRQCLLQTDNRKGVS
jgi:hypothetical protein